MTTKQTARVQDIIGLVNTISPPALAEEWDNVGLQVGDPGHEVTRVAIALDPCEETLDAAIDQGAELLLCHHPLIFRPLKQVSPTDGTGRLVMRAIRENVAIVSAHTNLDRARDGLNDWLAESLGLERCGPLEMPEGMLFKLAVFVPEEYREAVADALFAAGAGHIGAYDRCSFRVAGTGTFRPQEGSSPFVGQAGHDETVAEARLETVVPKESLGRVVTRMLKAHPYEEPAYDIYPIVNGRADVGLGRIGRLSEAVPLDAYAARVKSALGAGHLRVVGAGDRQIAKVAVCGGSGASLLAAAHRQGADLLVTGDVKYHDARIAESLGIALIDAGHFATERIMIDGLTRQLAKRIEKRGFAIELLPLSCEQEPVRIV